MTAYIIDTETTGITDPIEVIELAYGELALGITSISIHTQRLKPSKPIEWGALCTHNILMSELEGLSPASMARLPSDCTHIVGHNVDYDWKALGQPAVKRICTQAMARALWPHLDSHRLTALTYYTQGCTPETRDKVLRAHGAQADVQMVAELLPVLVAGLGGATSLAELWAMSEEARIPKIMAFGKHKGKPVEDVDYGWVSWYRRQEDTDPYLLKAFKRAGK